MLSCFLGVVALLFTIMRVNELQSSFLFTCFHAMNRNNGGPVCVCVRVCNVFHSDSLEFCRFTWA